jgi:hypothetical protein
MVVIATLALGSYCSGALAAEDAQKRAELAQRMTGAKITLEDGLKASEKSGKPISAKFEVEDGKLQFSAYTLTGDEFSEVVADPQTGKVEKTEKITDEEDLEAARSQKDAMLKATTPLVVVTEKAVKANNGSRAISVYPALKDGRSIAEVTLLKGNEFKTVTEKLE